MKLFEVTVSSRTPNTWGLDHALVITKPVVAINFIRAAKIALNQANDEREKRIAEINADNNLSENAKLRDLSGAWSVPLTLENVIKVDLKHEVLASKDITDGE